MYKENNYTPSQNGCGCKGEIYGCGVMKGHTFGVSDYPLAMVYSPLQVFESLYDKETALCRGTIFKELDLPFCGCASVNTSNGGRRHG